jgi:Rrf2 family iron-sulfur cluster assembly transcriptional regulator
MFALPLIAHILMLIASIENRPHRMILSKTAVYALKATLYLAEQAYGEPVRVDDISAALDVPRNYLSKILHVLARGDVLDSTRGPKGGFHLARRPEEMTLEDVIEHFDHLVSGSACLLGRSECSDTNPCAAHDRWKSTSVAVRTFFRETTVANLAHTGVLPA